MLPVPQPLHASSRNWVLSASVNSPAFVFICHLILQSNILGFILSPLLTFIINFAAQGWAVVFFVWVVIVMLISKKKWASLFAALIPGEIRGYKAQFTPGVEEEAASVAGWDCQGHSYNFLSLPG